METRSELPASVGNVRLTHTYHGRPWFNRPTATEKYRIRLSALNKPVAFPLTREQWVLYSNIRAFLGNHNRAYYCLGSENGQAFVARIAHGHWVRRERHDENWFWQFLKPREIREAEEVLCAKSERTGNLWLLPLPVNKEGLGPFMKRMFASAITMRPKENSTLLAENSAWYIQRGVYSRCRVALTSLAVVQGTLVCPSLGYRLILKQPYLIGLTPGWQYM